MTSIGIQNDPVIVGIKTVFDESMNQMRDDGEARIGYLRRVIKTNATR
jgi:hypothetical protein